MLFFVYGIDRPGSGPLRDELIEAHWAYMDTYADGIIARGPTLTADREDATGSVHIVDLPDEAAAHTFAFDEPNQRAGVYAEVIVRRYTDTLGGTMWQHATGSSREGFLLIGHGGDGPGTPRRLDGFLACGELSTVERLGTAAVAQTEDAVARFRAGPFDRVEVHPWQMGGRR